MRKLKIAVTGGIGSGKSAFCTILEELGFSVIKADPLAKELMQTNPALQSDIVKHFGPHSYENGQLNRPYLAEIVFSDREKLELINELVHPYVKAEVQSRMDAALEASDIVFHEAALIYEANMEKMFDAVIVVAAEKAVRMKRIMQRDEVSEKEVENRMKSQIDEEEKRKKADIVILNNNDLDSLRRKASQLIDLLRENRTGEFQLTL